MPKILNVPKENKKIIEKRRISVCMPTGMIEELNEALIKKKNLRKRSEWINEAIVQLSQLAQPEEYVLEDWIERGTGNSVIQVYLSLESFDIIRKILTSLEAKKNKSYDVSTVVRTAVTLKHLYEVPVI